MISFQVQIEGQEAEPSLNLYKQTKLKSSNSSLQELNSADFEGTALKSRLYPAEDHILDMQAYPKPDPKTGSAKSKLN